MLALRHQACELDTYLEGVIVSRERTVVSLERGEFPHEAVICSDEAGLLVFELANGGFGVGDLYPLLEVLHWRLVVVMSVLSG